MAATARFFIRKGLVSSPAADRGYEALEGDVLELGLESPELDVQKVEFTIVALGRWTTTPTFSPVSGLLATRTSVLQLTVQALQSPDRPAAMWIRCRINDGRKNGVLVADYTYERIIVVRNAAGMRGALYGETTQFSARSYADQLDELSEIVSTGSGGGATPGAMPNELILSGRREYDGSGYGTLRVALASSGHVDGAEAAIYVPPYTRTSVNLAQELNASGDAFDPAKGYEVFVLWRNGVARTLTRQVDKLDARAPLLVWAHVEYAYPRRVRLRFDRPCYVKDKAKLVFSSSNVDDVIDGDGTNEITVLLDVAADPSGDTLQIEAGGIASMCGVELGAVEYGLRYLVLPEWLSGVTGYRDSSGTIVGGQWLYGTESSLEDGVTWSVGTFAPAYTANGYDGSPSLRFVASEGDTLAPATALSPLIKTTEETVWLLTVPGTVTGVSAAGYSNPALVGAGTYWQIATKTNGTDADVCQVSHWNGSSEDKIEVDIVSRQPSLIRRRHVSSTLKAKVNGRAEGSVSASNVDGTISTKAFTIGGQGSADRCHDQDLLAVLICNVGHTDAQVLDGVEAYFSTLPFGGFLLLNPNLPERFCARVGDTLEIPWTQILLHPNAPASSSLSWLTFSVTGITGASVNSTRLQWTPGSGDTGTKTAHVSVVYNSKVIAEFDITIEVYAAVPAAGAISVCCLGDSWTDGNTLSVEVYNKLTAMGYTVTMLGARGGISVSSVNAATDVITTNGAHGYADKEPVEVYDSAGMLVGGMGTQYQTRYVFADTSTTLKLRATANGSAIDLTSDGWQTASVNTTTGLFTKVGHGMSANPKAYSRKPIIKFRANGGTLPTGLSNTTEYYVDVVDADSFYVRTQYSGTAVVVPSTGGSGSWQFGPSWIFVRSPKQRHEGRGGWSNAHYLEPVGNPVVGPGPFIDPSTGLFSWSYFKTNNLGGVAPDVFAVQLGINGGLNGGVTADDKLAMIAHTRSTIAAEAVQLLRSFLRAEASGRAVLMTPAAMNCRESAFVSVPAGSQWVHRRGVDMLQTAYRLAMQGRESERLFAGTFQVLDCAADFPSADAFHPSSHTKSGAQQAYAIHRAKSWV